MNQFGLSLRPRSENRRTLIQSLNSLFHFQGQPGRSSIARVERAHSYRARSASRRTARLPFPFIEGRARSQEVDCRSRIEALSSFTGKSLAFRGLPFENLPFLAVSGRRKLTLIDHSEREKNLVCLWPQIYALEPKGEE